MPVLRKEGEPLSFWSCWKTASTSLMILRMASSIRLSCTNLVVSLLNSDALSPSCSAFFFNPVMYWTRVRICSSSVLVSTKVAIVVCVWGWVGEDVKEEGREFPFSVVVEANTTRTRRAPTQDAVLGPTRRLREDLQRIYDNLHTNFLEQIICNLLLSTLLLHFFFF